MKTMTIIFAVWIGLGIQVLFGQRNLDTIYANEHQTVALFFPSPIERAVTGDERFVFSYDRETAGHLGLLQGVGGLDSNLLVITTDGKVYAYILGYAESLRQMNYFIDEGGAIGAEHPEKVMDEAADVKMTSRSNEHLCKLLVDRGPRNLSTVRSGGIRLRLEELVYDGDKVYLLVGIRNRSDIDFEIDRLAFFQVNGNKKRRASHQEISFEPLYSCTETIWVKSGKAIRLAYVLPKFVLGKGESLKLVLEEVQGNRRVVLVK